MDNEPEPNFMYPVSKNQFPPGYMDEIFTLWYSLGKPNTNILLAKIPPCPQAGNNKPGMSALYAWVKDVFRPRAVALDEEVMNKINERMVAEKVEMLNRHADIGIKMQDMAMAYLKDHEEDLGVSTSVKLLVAGVEIERESRGIATTVEKISRMSDTELEKEVQRLLDRAPLEILPAGNEDDSDADIEGES